MQGNQQADGTEQKPVLPVQPGLVPVPLLEPRLPPSEVVGPSQHPLGRVGAGCPQGGWEQLRDVLNAHGAAPQEPPVRLQGLPIGRNRHPVHPG